jgi:hypothetical protein
MKFGLIDRFIDKREGNKPLLYGFAAEGVAELLPMVSEENREAVEKGWLGEEQALEILHNLGYHVARIPDYVAELISATDPWLPKYYQDSYLGISVFTTDFSMEKFEDKLQRAKEAVASQFVTEALDDWVSDMENTDWSFYKAHPENWMRTIYNMSDEDVVKQLLLFKKEVEPTALEEGYVPDSSEVEIRDWSESLIHYLG